MIERMELGEFYKELRLARKLKQSDVACAGLTASQLSKFELGQSMLSADKLILAIQGINMNFDEFGHKLNNYQESLHMQIGRKVVDRFAHQDIAGLEQLYLGGQARTDGRDLSSFECYCNQRCHPFLR